LKGRLQVIDLKYRLQGSAKDTDQLDPQDFGFLDPDPQKYTDPRIRIQGVKYQPKTAKKIFLLLNPNSENL